MQRARDLIRKLTGKGDATQRKFELFIPSGFVHQCWPLVVMLHGCTQSGNEFAAATRMNALAEERGFLVLYPNQMRSANANLCWNWFVPAHQQRGQGEPATLADLTRQIGEEYGLGKVYLAGLSAGAAMAIVLSRAYPELYTAVGVHSGLAAGSAGNLLSALGAMRSGKGGLPGSQGVRTIVFHGDQDKTVHPQNCQHVLEQAAPDTSMERIEGRVPGGRAYTRTFHRKTDGSTLAESWLIHGAGHAWSGGDGSLPFTDPTGPDASREMIRFFLD